MILDEGQWYTAHFPWFQNHLTAQDTPERARRLEGVARNMLLSKVYSPHLHEAVFKNLARRWGVNINSHCANLHQGLSARQDREKGPAWWKSSWWKRRLVVDGIGQEGLWQRPQKGSKNWRAGGPSHHQEGSQGLDITTGAWKCKKKGVRAGRTGCKAATWICSQGGFSLGIPEGGKHYLRCATGKVTQSQSLLTEGNHNTELPFV